MNCMFMQECCYEFSGKQLIQLNVCFEYYCELYVYARMLFFPGK